MYAETRHMSARILKIWSMPTSVQRPWQTIARTHSIVARFDVNGDAIDASPSAT